MDSAAFTGSSNKVTWPGPFASEQLAFIDISWSSINHSDTSTPKFRSCFQATDVPTVRQFTARVGMAFAGARYQGLIRRLQWSPCPRPLQQFHVCVKACLCSLTRHGLARNQAFSHPGNAPDDPSIENCYISTHSSLCHLQQMNPEQEVKNCLHCN